MFQEIQNYMQVINKYSKNIEYIGKKVFDRFLDIYYDKFLINISRYK
jgi:hypothetical protein